MVSVIVVTQTNGSLINRKIAASIDESFASKYLVTLPNSDVKCTLTQKVCMFHNS